MIILEIILEFLEEVPSLSCIFIQEQQEVNNTGQVKARVDVVCMKYLFLNPVYCVSTYLT